MRFNGFRQTKYKCVLLLLIAVLVLSLFSGRIYAASGNDLSYDNRYCGLLGQGLIHDQRFNGCTIRYGVDVSKYQGDINWSKVKAAGAEFAIIRVGFRGYETGSLNEDPKADYNVKEALKAGLKIGVYFYSQAITVNEGIAEADYVMSLLTEYGVGPRDLALPVVFDVEYPSENGRYVGRLYTANLSKDTRTSITLAFLERVEAAGYRGCLYGSRSALSGEIKCDMSKIEGRYPIWMAAYTTSHQAGYSGDYCIWQHSCYGKVDGISGAVDLDIWYDDGYTMYNPSFCVKALSAQLTLKDNIAILINLSIPETASGWKAQVYFEKNDPSFSIVRKTVDLSPYAGKTYQVRFDGISAKELTDNVRVMIVDSKGKTVPIGTTSSYSDHFDYSASDYARTAAKLGGPDNARLAELGKALLNYGHEAQEYFSYKLDDLANQEDYLISEMKALKANDLSTYKATDIGGDRSAAGYYGIALSLKDYTEVVVYCTKNSAIMKDFTVISAGRSGEYWTGIIKGISAKDLGKTFVITVRYGEEIFKQEVSALSWAYEALSGNTASSQARELAKSVYLYYKAANSYFSEK